MHISCTLKLEFVVLMTHCFCLTVLKLRIWTELILAKDGGNPVKVYFLMQAHYKWMEKMLEILEMTLKGWVYPYIIHVSM